MDIVVRPSKQCDKFISEYTVQWKEKLLIKLHDMENFIYFLNETDLNGKIP